MSSYEDEFDLIGQGSEYSKGAVDFGSKSKETQRRRGVSSTEEEHRYKILIVVVVFFCFLFFVFCFLGVMWVLIGDVGLNG